jgi:prepilin peptidase CpaA
MALTEIGRWAIAMLLSAVLAWAAVSDIRERRIPNWTVLTILGLFVPWILLGHGVLLALAAGAIALVVSFALYALGWFGAGDSKLFSAVALFASLSHLAQLTLITALTGGLIAIVGLVLQPTRAMVMLNMRGKGDFGRGVPYGVAIAVGAAAVVWGDVLGLVLPGQG